MNSNNLHNLITTELQNKAAAIHGYDAILWKIRSGFVVVVYGAVSLLGGKAFTIPGISLCVIIAGMSLGAFLLDFGFVLRKMRVVVARDQLMDVACELAIRGDIDDEAKESVPTLLHVSGEDAHFDKEVFRRIWPFHWEDIFLVLYFLPLLIVLGIFC